MDGSDDLPELRVVLLGRPGSETTKVGNTILGKKAFPLVDLKEAQKQTATIAGRQVTVAISPDWYSSSSTPADVKKHIGSFVNLSTPGPHAFLLCVPVTKPTDGEMKGMDMMENLFSPEAVSDHMIVLLTHTEELKEGEVLDDYLKANRRDIMKLVERCGDRHYVLKTQHDMDALLVEVEHSLIMSGSDHFECPLYEEAEARLLERQVQLAKAAKEFVGIEDKTGEGKKGSKNGIPIHQLKKVREAAQKSMHDKLVQEDDPNISLSPGIRLFSMIVSFVSNTIVLSTQLRRRVEDLVGQIIPYVPEPLMKLIMQLVEYVTTKLQGDQPIAVVEVK